MKTFIDNKIIKTPWIEGVISEPNITSTDEYVYHSTRSFEDISLLKVGDKLTLNASKAFLGYGLYWSTRREIVYGPVSFALKGITARKVKELDMYTWYRSGDMDIVIEDIDLSSNVIYVSLCK